MNDGKEMIHSKHNGKSVKHSEKIVKRTEDVIFIQAWPEGQAGACGGEAEN